VDDPAWRVISDEIKGIIGRLLPHLARGHRAGRPGVGKLAPGVCERAISPGSAHDVRPIKKNAA
jgi:hypothetical protein